VYLDLGTKGEGPGDIALFGERLYRGSTSSPAFGRTEIRCMFFRQGQARCEGAIILPRGTIEAAGHITFGKRIRLPVVGGTKAYAGARGELVLTELSEARSRYVVNLVD